MSVEGYIGLQGLYNHGKARGKYLGLPTSNERKEFLQTAAESRRHHENVVEERNLEIEGRFE